MLDAKEIMRFHTEEKRTQTRSFQSGRTLPRDTTITRHGEVIGTLDSVGAGLRCDCPINNSMHEDGCGDDYAFTVQLSGGEVGVHCSGSHCNCTYIPEPIPIEVVDDGFDAIDESGDARWFDRTIGAYCIRGKNGIEIHNKQAFTQILHGLGEYIKGWDALIPVRYSNYAPACGEMIDKDTINTFIPTVLMEQKRSSSDMPTMIGKLLDNLFIKESERKQFLNWLAFIYQYRKKSGVTWVIKGAQGSGKGILCGYIFSKIFGNNFIGNLTDSAMSGDFNGYLDSKLVVHFNEISAETKKARVEIKNKLKTWSTDATVVINEKGVKLRSVNNHANFIINTNEAIPVDIEADDRRFSVVTTGGSLKELGWFKGAASIDAMMDEVSDLCAYLRGFSVDVDMATTSISNESKNEVTELSRSVYEDIAIALKSGNFDFFLEAGAGELFGISEIEREFDIGEISNRHLGELIGCVVAGISYNYWTKQIILKHHVGKKFMKRIGGVVTRGYTMDRTIPF
jgi:hypothetical protein